MRNAPDPGDAAVTLEMRLSLFASLVRGIFIAFTVKWDMRFHHSSQGDRMMPALRDRSQTTHLESISSLTVVDARTVELLVMDCKQRRNPRLVGTRTISKLATDPLDSARGIFNGLGVSFVLWGFIGFVVMLMG